MYTPRRFEWLHLNYRHKCASCQWLLFPGERVLYDWHTHKVYCKRCGEPDTTPAKIAQTESD